MSYQVIRRSAELRKVRKPCEMELLENEAE
jgi:hypothetical protein